MMIWLAFMVLVAIALFLLLRPLIRPPAALNDARSSDLAVYRDQLREVEADIARALISPAEAEAARSEIKRKMLAVAPEPQAARDPQRAVRAVRVALAAGLPALAAAIYLAIGQPDLPGQEFAAVRSEAPAQLADVETLAARLAERLKQSPNDAQGWRMLGWSYASLGRHAEASKAYANAVALDGNNTVLLSQYGESLVQVAGGLVTPQADGIFERALAIDPREPRAQFFRGLALEQQGKTRQALTAWVKIIREGQADATWMPFLRQRATELALKLKLDPAKEIPASAVPPQAPAGR